MAAEHVFYPRWQKGWLVMMAVLPLPVFWRVDFVHFAATFHSILYIGYALSLALMCFWMARSGSWPWSGPALRLTDEGVTIWPKRRTSYFMPWEDIKNLTVDSMSRKRFFMPIDPAKHHMRLFFFKRAPFCPMDLWSKAGEDFASVVLQYRPDWAEKG